jgi:hypothetical protein
LLPVTLQNCVVYIIKASFHYRGQEFIRVGYYVNNDYGDPELRETQPPSAPQFDKLQRNILATNPRVTRFKVWLSWQVLLWIIVTRYISVCEQQCFVGPVMNGWTLKLIRCNDCEVFKLACMLHHLVYKQRRSSAFPP